MMTAKTLIWFSNPEHVFCYNYERLREKEKKIYRKLADGLFSFQPVITLRWTTPKTVSEIYEKLKLDLPAAFFDTGLDMIWTPALGTVRVKPQYRFPKDEAENILAEILDRIQPLLLQCMGMSDLEKETFIHDWFCQNVVYDYNYAQKMGGSSFEMAAPLLWGRGVCSGISKAAKFIFDQVGLKSLLMLGRTLDTPAGPGEDHCWLMVKIQEPGQTACRYHLDITFDMTSKSKRYFNMTSQEILADRILI